MLYDQIETALRNQQEQLSVPEETTEEEVHACIRTAIRKFFGFLISGTIQKNGIRSFSVTP